MRFVRGYCRGVYRFRTDAQFGVDVLRKYTGETDEGVLAETWLLFARLMGGMMFPSLEGVRAAVDLLRRLGAIGDHVTAEDQLSLEPVAALERERYFATFMGRGNAEQAVRDRRPARPQRLSIQWHERNPWLTNTSKPSE